MRTVLVTPIGEGLSAYPVNKVAVNLANIQFCIEELTDDGTVTCIVFKMEDGDVVAGFRVHETIEEIYEKAPL